MKNLKFTRKEYMADKCTHSEYYAQFVTPSILESVWRSIGQEKIRASTDEHFNDIPLKKWDIVSTNFSQAAAPKFKEAGDFVTQAGLVCVAKQAAKMIKEENTYQVSFLGRTKNALGIVHDCSVQVYANNEEQVKLKLYDTHEHISNIAITKV